MTFFFSRRFYIILYECWCLSWTCLCIFTKAKFKELWGERKGEGLQPCTALALPESASRVHIKCRPALKQISAAKADSLLGLSVESVPRVLPWQTDEEKRKLKVSLILWAECWASFSTVYFRLYARVENHPACPLWKAWDDLPGIMCSWYLSSSLAVVNESSRAKHKMPFILKQQQ